MKRYTKGLQRRHVHNHCSAARFGERNVLKIIRATRDGIHTVHIVTDGQVRNTMSLIIWPLSGKSKAEPYSQSGCLDLECIHTYFAVSELSRCRG